MCAISVKAMWEAATLHWSRRRDLGPSAALLHSSYMTLHRRSAVFEGPALAQPNDKPCCTRRRALSQHSRSLVTQMEDSNTATSIGVVCKREVLRFGLGALNTSNRQQEGDFWPCSPFLVHRMAAAHHFPALRAAMKMLQVDSFTDATAFLMRP